MLASVDGSLKRKLMGGSGPRTTKRNELLSAPRMDEDDFVEMLRELSGVSKQTAVVISETFPYGDGLEHTSVAVLKDLGASKKQAERIKSAFDLVRKCDAACQRRRRQVGSPREGVAAALEALESSVANKDQEYFVVILLDARQNVIDIFGTSVGTLSRVAVHPRDVFKHAIRSNTNSIILAHNHPSGDPQPSEADYDVTQRMVSVGHNFGIPVLDSLIVTPSNRYSSMAEAGTMPSP